MFYYYCFNFSVYSTFQLKLRIRRLTAKMAAAMIKKIHIARMAKKMAEKMELLLTIWNLQQLVWPGITYK